MHAKGTEKNSIRFNFDETDRVIVLSGHDSQKGILSLNGGMDSKQAKPEALPGCRVPFYIREWKG